MWLSGLKTQCCLCEDTSLAPGPEWVKGGVAVAVVQAPAAAPIRPPGLGTSIYHRCGHEEKKKANVKLNVFGSSHHGSVVMNLTSIHKDAGLMPGLAQWVKDPLLL